jgi:hypothetical protein
MKSKLIHLRPEVFMKSLHFRLIFDSNCQILMSANSGAIYEVRKVQN